MGVRVFLDLDIGDPELHQSQSQAFQLAQDFFSEVAPQVQHPSQMALTAWHLSTTHSLCLTCGCLPPPGGRAAVRLERGGAGPGRGGSRAAAGGLCQQPRLELPRPAAAAAAGAAARWAAGHRAQRRRAQGLRELPGAVHGGEGQGQGQRQGAALQGRAAPPGGERLCGAGRGRRQGRRLRRRQHLRRQVQGRGGGDEAQARRRRRGGHGQQVGLRLPPRRLPPRPVRAQEG